MDEACFEGAAQSTVSASLRSGADVAGKQLPPPPPQLPALPKSRGPRRAQLVQKFLTQHMCFSAHDFFDLTAHGLEAPASSPLPAADVLPPQLQADLLLELASVGRAPLSNLALYARPGHPREKIEDRVDSEVDLQPCDPTFAPKGLESFICKMQSPSSSKRKAILDDDDPSPWKTKRIQRREMIRAEALFRKVDCQAGKGDLEVTWEDDEDEAPVACIPCY